MGTPDPRVGFVGKSLRWGVIAVLVLLCSADLQADSKCGSCPSSQKENKPLLKSFAESISWILFPWGKIHIDLPNDPSWLAETVHRILLKWDRFRAERGSRSAAYELGRAIYFGMGTPPCEEEGLRWLLFAADQGDPLARYAVASIGFCRYAKRSVVPGQPFAKRNYPNLPKDIRERFTEKQCQKWLAEAVESGNPKAMRLRAFVPEKIETDKTEALKHKLIWLEKAAAAGDPYAESCRWDLIGYAPRKRSFSLPAWVWTPTGTP